MIKSNKQNINKFYWVNLLLIFSLVVSFSLFLFQESYASGASLYISPGTGTSFIGETFDISIFVNTGGQNINVIKVDLKFDPRKVQIVSPTAGKSFISVWVSQPTYSNVEGTASFQGGTPSPGINTSSGLVSTITFRAVAPGETVMSILDSSQVLLDDGRGTNILDSVGRGSYKINIPPPEGPKVFSSTHPDQNKWYKNNNPSLSWEKEEGTVDFSYGIDNDFYGIPDNEPEGGHTTVSFSDLEDGIWYFHIKARKGNAWGGISHYLIQIDNTSPANFNIVFEPPIKTGILKSKEPVVYFITTDALSGIDHYEIKVIDLRKSVEKKETGFFVEVISPYRLPVLESGEYEIVVRVYDQSMNYSDISKRVEIIPTEKIFYAGRKGINVRNVFISWQRLILILITLVILSSVIIFFWYRKSKYFLERKEALIRLKKKAQKDSKKIESKLYDKK